MTMQHRFIDYCRCLLLVVQGTCAGIGYWCLSLNGQGLSSNETYCSNLQANNLEDIVVTQFVTFQDPRLVTNVCQSHRLRCRGFYLEGQCPFLERSQTFFPWAGCALNEKRLHLFKVLNSGSNRVHAILYVVVEPPTEGSLVTNLVPPTSIAMLVLDWRSARSGMQCQMSLHISSIPVHLSRSELS